MARIKGIDLPKNKRGVISLTYIYGIGSSYYKRYFKQLKYLLTKKYKIGMMMK